MRRTIAFVSTIIFASVLSAQPIVVDKVIGVVGKYPVLLSDLQNIMLQREEEGMPQDQCKSFEMLVFQKLLVAQADRDSVTVSDAEVDTELNRRMNYYIQQFGSEAKLEEFYGKRTNVIKDELRGDVQDQLVAEKMQGKIAGDIKLTPAEVRLFYNSIPIDSLPLIESEVELQQLVKKPTYSEEAKKAAKDFLEEIRQEVLSKINTDPSIMKRKATLYTNDESSASTGGLYESIGRGVLEPAFEAVVFRLKNGEISHVFETTYGYHFVQLLQRRGDLVDFRHILIIPKMTNDDFFRCKLQLDSIHTAITEGKITFEEGVKRFSDDADTKQNSGLMVNPMTANTKFDQETIARLDKNLITTLNNMQPGDVSKPMQFMTPDGKPGFRVIKLKTRIDPHKANLKDDYQRLSLMATETKRKELIGAWIAKRSKITYIKLDPAYTCTFENKWTINN